MSMNHLSADAVVIGGGAAGCMCAVMAAENGKQIVLLEPNRQLGRKLRITGKGRCNVTNQCDIKRVMENMPGDGRFLFSALNAFPPEQVMDFFKDAGVSLKTERGNRVFPVSDNANDIADALSNLINKRNVTVIHEKAVNIELDNGMVSKVITKNTEIDTNCCAICTGGLSYPKTGSDGSGYLLAENLGHVIADCHPSLVPLESDDKCCQQLQGLALKNVKITAMEDGRAIFREQGEMLFAHFGVTGPIVLSASAHMRNFGKALYIIEIDFKPALDDDTLEKRVLRDFDKYKNKSIGNALVDLLPHAMIPVMLNRMGVPRAKPVHEITKQERKSLIHLLKHFSISISGTRPFDEAIITAGGVKTIDINPRTMESKIVQGLFFAGEIMDLDAYTGGFNLQIAWSTGFVAGKTISNR